MLCPGGLKYTVKPVYNDHLMGYSVPSGAHVGGQGPPRWAPEGIRLLTRVNWYLQSLKHITESITGNEFHYRGGRYRQVSLYFAKPQEGVKRVNTLGIYCIFGQRTDIKKKWKSETKLYEWYPLLYLFIYTYFLHKQKSDGDIDILNEFLIDTSITFVGHNYICLVNVTVYNISILCPEWCTISWISLISH